MRQNSESGFSYIDVMIAIVILTIGILALLAGITASLVQSRGQEQQTLAKQIATSTMESIMSVKETDSARLGWNAIGNVGSNPVPFPSGPTRGIFVTGFQPVLLNAGVDEVLGTAAVPLVQRRIVITDLCDPDRPSYNCPTPGPIRVRMRNVAVTVTYQVGGLQREEVLETVLTDYGIEN
jgi:type II secretory pathway pseudopilin PulG